MATAVQATKNYLESIIVAKKTGDIWKCGVVELKPEFLVVELRQTHKTQQLLLWC